MSVSEFMTAFDIAGRLALEDTAVCTKAGNSLGPQLPWPLLHLSKVQQHYIDALITTRLGRF
jgi:hypothetical protein